MRRPVIDARTLQIVHYPDPVLRGNARPIPAVTDEVRAVAVRMLELMHAAPGVGLAGPQVGLPWRLFVANATGEPADDRVFINPQLSQPSREQVEQEEGCLSLPGINGQVRRPQRITVTAVDLDGREFTLTSDELPARIWQHECDHLDGVLIIDRMPRVERMANRDALRQLEAAD
jgi:peptide deformylase